MGPCLPCLEGDSFSLDLPCLDVLWRVQLVRITALFRSIIIPQMRRNHSIQKPIKRLLCKVWPLWITPHGLSIPWGLVGSRLFGKRGCDPGMLPGGWFGIRREGLGPPGYRGDMNGCRKDTRRTFQDNHELNTCYASWQMGFKIPKISLTLFKSSNSNTLR